MATSTNLSNPQISQSTNHGAQIQVSTDTDKQQGQKTEDVSKEKHTGKRYFPALVLVAVVFSVPVLAALLTIVFYLAPSSVPAHTSIPVLQQIVMFLDWLGSSNIVILLGIGVTLVVWLLLALPCMRFATAEGARSSDYEALDRQIGLLRAQNVVLKNHEPQVVGNPADQDHQLARKITLKEVEAELDRINKIMKADGLIWVLTTGYVNLWSRVNRVDEAMINVLPDERLIEDAKYDQLRLEGSDITNEKNLRDDLDKAIATLRTSDKTSNAAGSSEQVSDAANASHPVNSPIKSHEKQGWVRSIFSSNKKDVSASVPAHTNKGGNPEQGKTETKQNKEDTGQSKVETISPSKPEAKTTIFQVRCTLHKFTNERWDGLVRSRNQLMGTALLTGFFTYILVIIAILAKVPPINIEQAMVFYFLGAVVGLFSQLYNEWNAKDTVKDDYGQTMARVLVTPLLSGMAALVGVFLVTMLSIALITPQNNSSSTSNTTSTTPTVTVGSTSTPVSNGTQAATPTPATAGTTFPKIGTIYNLDMYPQNLVLAAIFGFLPSLVIGLLKKETDKVESQIQSSSAGDQTQSDKTGDQAQSNAAGKQKSGKGGSGK